ncbi:MAG: hypothetical protein DMG24_06435 [Acidobacteria bacterium]|nr:MAG: hypothetical protein DMG24_06435 [Acidobacteriota bacterium]
MASTSVTTGWPTCGTSSLLCPRSPCCSQPASPKTSPTRARRRDMTKSSRRPRRLTPARCAGALRTQVGERGMCLSGGERQRISLARAFLKNAPILVLDEPTSSVDMGTEGVILEAMERLMRGRTTFLISHRPNAFKNCDLVLVMENGRLVAQAADLLAAARSAVAFGGHALLDKEQNR